VQDPVRHGAGFDGCFRLRRHACVVARSASCSWPRLGRLLDSDEQSLAVRKRGLWTGATGAVNHGGR
jgi:hypothetical protein